MHRSRTPPFIAQAAPVGARLVYVLDEDRVTRRATVMSLRDHGFEPHPYIAAQDFLDELPASTPGCILLGTLGDTSGVASLIGALGGWLAAYPVIVAILPGDVAGAVQAMKLGASDVIERAMDPALLPAILDPVFEMLRCRSIGADIELRAQDALRILSSRERDILSGLVEGLSSKQIAPMLGLNLRTVEMSRSKMMHRLDVGTLSDVLQLAFRADVATLSQRRIWATN